ncbi:efflux transporter, outer membrane factor (OMF) lipo, NodT family protein, partial [Vibrio parahaemolyticus SBR10290]
MRNVSNA